MVMQTLSAIQGRRARGSMVVAVGRRGVGSATPWIDAREVGTLHLSATHVLRAEAAGDVLLVRHGYGWAAVRTAGGVRLEGDSIYGMYSVRAVYTGQWWPEGTPLAWVLDEASGAAEHARPAGGSPDCFPRLPGGSLPSVRAEWGPTMAEGRVS